MGDLDADESVLVPPIAAPMMLAPANEPASLDDFPEDSVLTVDTPYIARRIEEAARELAGESLVADSNSEIVRERYDDGSVKVERTVTQDELGNFVNNGPYRMYSPSGSLVAEGNFQMGARHGDWRRVYETADASLLSAYPYSEFQAPFVSQATFTADNLSGSWIITDAQGKLVSEIPFRDGLRHGQAIWNHPNGKRMYEANYRDGMLEGVMAEYDAASNELTSHTFQDGRREEREVEHYKNQQPKAEFLYLSAQQTLKQRDDWWNAKPAVYETAGKRLKHGSFVEYHANGQKKSTGKYEEGHLTGEFASWFENGQRETLGHYHAGVAVGAWAWWHPNGMRRAEGHYANGAPEGQWISWTPEGKVAKRQTYADARPSDVVRSRNANPARPSSANAQRRVQR
ncbi:toxin-antitoxin system YwqK family antitoxin [Rosistilla carotiformis]|nr:hypothetical protein [Rosistilla carotiformis]